MNDKPVVIDVDGQMVVDEMRLAATAAVKGIGIAYVFQQFVEADIKSGALKVVLEKKASRAACSTSTAPAAVRCPGNSACSSIISAPPTGKCRNSVPRSDFWWPLSPAIKEPRDSAGELRNRDVSVTHCSDSSAPPWQSGN